MSVDGAFVWIVEVPNALVIVGYRLFTQSQVRLLPGAIAAASSVTEPAARFGVAVPAAKPEHEMLATP